MELPLVCPNPDCRHKKRTGSPAEYFGGRETCADCGTALVLSSSLPAPAAEPKPSPELWKRLGVVLAVPLALEAGSRVVLPGIERSELPPELAGAPALGVLSLGMIPYLTAAALVELVAVLVPRWRALRISGPAGRARLHRATLGVTLLFATIQAWGVATYAESALADTLVSVAPWFRGVAVPTLVAGTFLFVAAARFLDRRGLGAGVSVLLAGGVVAMLVDHVVGIWRQVSMGALTPLGLVAGLAGLAFAAFATWFVLRRHRAERPTEEGPAIAIRAPAAGLSPLEVVGSASGLLLFAGLPPTWIVPAVVALLATPLFAMAYSRIDLVSALLARAVGGPVPAEVFTDRVRRARRRALGISLAWVAAIALVVPLLDEVTGGSSAPLAAGVVALTAIAMDLRAEWHARRRAPSLVPIWPVHRIYEVDVAVAILAERGIEVHPRAVHHRTLLQFFGPYVPVDLLVPEDRAAEAHALLERRLVRPAPDRPPPA